MGAEEKLGHCQNLPIICFLCLLATSPTPIPTLSLSAAFNNEQDLPQTGRPIDEELKPPDLLFCQMNASFQTTTEGTFSSSSS